MMHMICINLLCMDIFVNVICYAYIHDYIYIYIDYHVIFIQYSFRTSRSGQSQNACV